MLLVRPSRFSFKTLLSNIYFRLVFFAGDTHFIFSMIHNPTDARQQLGRMDDNRDKFALCAVNDDVDEEFEETDSLMRDWLERRFPEPASWEAPREDRLEAPR